MNFLRDIASVVVTLGLCETQQNQSFAQNAKAHIGELYQESKKVRKKTKREGGKEMKTSYKNMIVQFLFGLGIFSMGFGLLIILVTTKFPFTKEWSMAPLFPIVAGIMMLVGIATACGKGPINVAWEPETEK